MWPLRLGRASPPSPISTTFGGGATSHLATPAYGGGVQRSSRRKAYFWLMGTCLVLIVLAWNVVRLWSTAAAVAMSVVAAVLAPVAVIIGNLGALDASAPPTYEIPPDHPENDR